MACVCKKRQRVDLLLPPDLKDAVDDFCRKKDITRTAFIENLIRQFFKKRKIVVQTAKPHYYNSVEEMPLEP